MFNFRVSVFLTPRPGPETSEEENDLSRWSSWPDSGCHNNYLDLKLFSHFSFEVYHMSLFPFLKEELRDCCVK